MKVAWLVRRARRSLRYRPSVFVFAVLAFALLGLLAGGARVASLRADALLPQLGGSVHVIAYLDDGMDAKRVQALAELLRRIPGVDAVEAVTSSEALARLRAELGDRPSGARIMEAVEEGFLPRSLEIRLTPSATLQARGQALAAQLLRVEGIADVDAMTDGVSRLRTLADLLRALGRGLFSFALVTGMAIVFMALVNGRQKRRREAEVLALLGETQAAIRAPSILGGACAALVGAVLGAGLLWLGFLVLDDSLLAALAGAHAVAPAATGVPLAWTDLAVGAGALVLLGLFLGGLLAPRLEPRRA